MVNAVQCAVDIQATLKSENAFLIPERRMEFRIGINLGDVMVEGEQIYGDGVNVAPAWKVWLKPVASASPEPYMNRSASGWHWATTTSASKWSRTLSSRCGVFRILANPGIAVHSTTKEKPQADRKYLRKGVWSLVGLAIIVATITLVQHLSLRPQSTAASTPPTESAAALPLPDKPSVAVLPFTNVSGDPEQEYLSDGITDNIITALARLPDLFVIARTSTFTYKGGTADVAGGPGPWSPLCPGGKCAPGRGPAADCSSVGRCHHGCRPVVGAL